MGNAGFEGRAEQRRMPAARIGALLCLPLAVLLSAACAGLESVPPGGAAPASVAQGGTTQPSTTPPPETAQPDATRGGAAVSASPGPTATPAANAPARTGIAKTAAPATAASRGPASPAPASPPLDLASLQKRLRQTNAIGVVTKIALKNQVDDLLEQFRGFYQGRHPTSLAALRQPYDRLLLKVLVLLQDGDPSLAGAISASREAIWGVLADPVRFASIRD